MYTLDDLINDARLQRGALTKKAGGSADDGYQKVWDAFNRYVTYILDRRQTLSVLNFCKIGWKVEEARGGAGTHGSKARLRPHFQLAEHFVRSHGLDPRAHPVTSDKLLTQLEEFNFSKAAIKFSQSLTKETLFMGLRALTQQLGEAVLGGKTVSIEFEAGKLVGGGRSRELRFAFHSDFYLREGLTVPEGACKEAANYKPSVSFAPPSQDALTLSLKGSNRPATGCSSAGGHDLRADPYGGWQDPDGREIVNEGQLDIPSAIRGRLGRGGGAAGGSVPATPGPGLQEGVEQQALGRHIATLQAEAAIAVREKEEWEKHLKRCHVEEERELEWRKNLNKENAEQLRMQMQQQEKRRQQARAQCVEQASAHDFPSFKEAPEAGFHAYIMDRKENLKADLDKQVEAKHRVKLAQKQQERLLENFHVEATQRELAAMKQGEANQRAAVKATLQGYWSRESHLKAVTEAIQEHHKAPGKKGNLVRGLLNGLGGGGEHGGGSRGASSAGRSSRGFQDGVALGSLSSGAALDALVGLGDSVSQAGSVCMSARGGPEKRPVTGSVRKVPIGAAGSLALMKQKASTPRR
eukprot:TRINITY_DN26992_c0_g1_i1.p1 TRINITY_DN26992_c0_g1~~TRINITY_DN26992_c0_g1_i1.p1  ORF type:complete len:581 (+),score=176.57 TRINITY_DN26992_c0_g1_i1:133-1875(+)